jgi:hypothetical protein
MLFRLNSPCLQKTSQIFGGTKSELFLLSSSSCYSIICATSELKKLAHSNKGSNLSPLPGHGKPTKAVLLKGINTSLLLFWSILVMKCDCLVVCIPETNISIETAE